MQNYISPKLGKAFINIFFNLLEFGWNYLQIKNPKTLISNELGFKLEVPSGFEPL